MALPLAPILAGAAGLISSGINAASTARTNRRAEAFSREMFEKQGAREIEYFDMQNRYNHPSSQMQRLQDAGLNPNLVYGSGAQQQAASISSKPAAQPTFKAPQVDLTSIAQQAMFIRQAEANIERTEAETAAIQSRTVDQDFKNSVNQHVGMEAIARASAFSTELLERQSASQLQKVEAELVGLFTSPDGQRFTTDDPQSPVAKAARAGIQQTLVNLQNSKHLGNIRRFESEIKEFGARLTREGIPADSPWHAKFLGDLMRRVFGPGWSNFDQPENPAGYLTQPFIR